MFKSESLVWLVPKAFKCLNQCHHWPNHYNDECDRQTEGFIVKDFHLILNVIIFPDTVTSHYLASSGLETSDPRIVKLVSLAAQKFVSDVAADALNHCKMRQQRSVNMVHSTLPKRKDKYEMTTEDLSQALGEQGVSLKKPPYYQ